jgi:hypothetical protein
VVQGEDVTIRQPHGLLRGLAIHPCSRARDHEGGPQVTARQRREVVRRFVGGEDIWDIYATGWGTFSQSEIEDIIRAELARLKRKERPHARKA